MRVRVGGRGTGKTTEMIDYLLTHPNTVMVCINEQEADRVRRLVMKRFEGLPGVEAYYAPRMKKMVISANHTRDRLHGFEWYGRHSKPHLVIDNWDLLPRYDQSNLIRSYWPIDYVTETYWAADPMIWTEGNEDIYR